MATLGGDCEPLHGHSYEVRAELEGSLTDDSWVADFVELKSMLVRICGELDHRFLLQRESLALSILQTDEAWEVRTNNGTQYVLPTSDVVVLPVDNSTAERLAAWLNGRVW